MLAVKQVRALRLSLPSHHNTCICLLLGGFMIAYVFLRVPSLGSDFVCRGVVVCVCVFMCVCVNGEGMERALAGASATPPLPPRHARRRSGRLEGHQARARAFAQRCANCA